MDKINNKRKKYKKILNVVVYTSFGLLLIYHLTTRERLSKLYVAKKHIIVSPAADANFEEYIDGYGVALPEFDKIPPPPKQETPEPFRPVARHAFVDVDPFKRIPDITYRDQKPKCEPSDCNNDCKHQPYCDEEFKEKLRSAQVKIAKKHVLLEEGTIKEEDFEQAVSDYSHIVENFCNITFSKGKEALTNLAIEFDEDFDEDFEHELEESLEDLQGKLAELLVSASSSGFDTYSDCDSNKKDVDFWLNLPDANVHMKAEIHKELLHGAKPGQKTEIMIQGKPYTVEIAEVEDHEEDEFLVVDFTFTNEPDSNIKIGKALPLKIKIKDEKESILLKNGCYFQETGGHWVYVLSEDGSYAVKRKIRLGRKNDKFVEVIEGLEPGERVIISSYKHFKKKDKLIFK